MRIVEMIRVKLDEGVLPWDEPRKIWIGYGQRRPRDACELSPEG